MKQKLTKLILALLCLLTFSFAKAQVGAVIWQEDFNTFNTSIWSIVTGDGTGTPAGPGWGNQELVYYNTPNVYIGDVPGEAGNKALILEAKRENMGTRNFTSGKVLSKGNLAVKYGLVEMRIRVPNVEGGLWPAGWMLGTSNLGWPNNGEMDLMEMGFSLADRTRQGYPSSGVNNYVASNAFFGTSDGGVANIAWDVNYCQPYVAAAPVIDKFLLYRVYWSSQSIRFTVVDAGVERDVFTAPMVFNTESEEFKNPFYFILNLTVGGTLTGLLSPDQITALFPAKMYIDYIKVSKWNGEGEVTVGGPVAETGTFGVFTDNTSTTNKLNAGVSSDIWAWNNLVAGTTPAYEGSNVIAWATTAANTWFGGGIQARQATNMSNFATNGNLKFRIKIPANVNFKIGMTDNYTNEKYISFPANTNQYGLTRDGNWGQVTIPISAFGGSMAFQSMNYMFAIVSDGALPTSTFQFAIDDIVWEGGGGTVNVPVTGVSIVPTSISVAKGATYQLSATVAPSNATNKNVTWASSNTAIATVNSSGLVTGVNTGTANITVTTVDGAKTDVCAATVTTANVPVTSVSVSPTTASLAVNATQQLTATVLPTNATNKSVNWTSSNTTVATVSASGLVTAKAAGTATITVTTVDQEKTATSAITVTSTPTQTPYTGTPISIPGVIEAENFDNGGQGIAYSDAETANQGGQYRTTEGVDIEICNEGGYNVGWTAAGEWMEYTINVATAGTYNIDCRVASGTGGTFSIAINDVDKTGTLTVPNTTGWQIWQSVTKTGVALSAGTQILKVVSNGGFNLNKITISSAGISVTGVTIVPTSVTVNKGATYQLSATVAPSNATNKSVTWTSSNTAVATVSTTGLVTAVNSGTANITVKTTDGNFTDVCAVTVPTTTVPVTGVTIVPTSISVASGATYQLSATVAPSNATNKSVTWTSSNTAIATVSSTGLVTGVAAGSANVTVKTTDGNFTDVCAVTVTTTKVNLALNKTVTTSTVEAAGYEGSKAVDGNATSTRWSSVFADPQWIYVDLGASYSVNEVKITWEAACASNFTVQISNDAATWTTMKTITGNTTLVNDYTGLTGTGRYVRIYGSTRATAYGYSIFELEVYGTTVTNRAPVANAGADKAITLPTSSVALSGSGSDPDGNAITYSWIQVSGPNTTATWSSKTVAAPTVSGLVAGSYTFRLTVSDGSLSSSDDVIVTVSSAPTTCSITAATGDFKTNISSDASNPTLTFVPITSGAGSSVCILYYGTSATGTYAGYNVTANTAYRITAAAGTTIYFYYTYSTPTGEKSTVNTRNSFTVGNCSATVKSAFITTDVTEVEDNIVEAYPVPMIDVLNIKISGNEYETAIITDLSGKMVKRKIILSNEDIQLDVSDLKKGVYFLNVQGAGKRVTKKLIK